MINENVLKKLEEQNKKTQSALLRKVLFKSKISEVTRVMEAEGSNQFRFSTDIKTLPITDQKASGRCWIFAGLNFLREFMAKDLGLKEFEFSQNYVAFFDKLEKINYFMESMNDFLTTKSVDDRTLTHLLQTGIQDGGQWQMFVNVVEKYGLVPKDAMPETASSSATREVNQLINIKLRKYAADARDLASKGQQNRVAALRDTTLAELYNLLVATFGMPPKKFDFEYIGKDDQYNLVQNLTPKTFVEKFLPNVNLKDYVSIINSPTVDKPFYNTYTIEYLGNVVGGDDIIHLNLPMSELKALVLKQLKDGLTVWFGSDVAFYGNSEGVWDDAQYEYEQTLGLNLKVTKDMALDYRMSQMGHAMTLTGVSEVNGKPNKWKIQNSWGEKAGTKGYYLCSDSWFVKFVYQVVIKKDYLSDKQKEALEKKAKKLKPWDPMGSLAK